MRRLREDRGLTIPFLAMLLPVLLGLAALVVDIGNASQYRRQAQNAADAAAMAGTQDLPNATTARTQARDYAARNLNIPASSLGTVACPPGDANRVCYQTADGRIRVQVTTPYQSNTNRINVQVCRTVPTTFGRVLGNNNLNPCARASGSRNASAGITGPAIVALNPSIASFEIASGAVINITGGGGIVVNSSSNEAMKVSSGAITIESPGKLEIFGKCKDCNKATLNPQNSKLAEPYADPYASLPPPPHPGGTCRSGSGGALPATFTGAGTNVTIGPACFGSRFNVSNGATVTLEPGVYWLNDGWRMAANLRTTTSPFSPVTGTGVIIYNNSGASEVASGADVQLRPPTTGTWAGISYFQARTNTDDFTIGGSNPSFDLGDGTFYMPGAGAASSIRSPRLTFNASGAVWSNGGVISQSIYVGGTSTLNGHTPGGVANPDGPPELMLIE